jgi:two-component system, NtrC family, nitrogen regulation sensor histidine kinase NtrY
VRVATVDSEVVVEVEDNGKGLPPQDRERLLEPYMTTREKGTGLGLAIVRKIMEEHGGSIALLDSRAARESGRGALVRLVFPAAGQDGAAAVTAAVAVG